MSTNGKWLRVTHSAHTSHIISPNSTTSAQWLHYQFEVRQLRLIQFGLTVWDKLDVNNNNNNNKHDNVYGAVIMAEPLREFTWFTFDECRMAPSDRRPKTKPNDLGCKSACTGCQKLHPPSPFIITQPKSWYSFYCPTEGRRLSRPSWLVTYRDGLPVHRRSPIRVLTRSDVAQLRWSKPTCYH